MKRDKPGILFIDDSTQQLEMVRQALVPRGYDVRTAESVSQAVRLLAHRELIIVDYHMPDMSGPEAVRVLKQSGQAPAHAAYFLYTSDPNAASNFRAKGFDGAFTSKGDPDVLVSQLATAERILRMRRFMTKSKGHAEG